MIPSVHPAYLPLSVALISKALGGFPDEPIMEDFELVQKIRRASAALTARIPRQGNGESQRRYRLLTLGSHYAECSARRWAHMGVWRANLINQVCNELTLPFALKKKKKKRRQSRIELC